MAKVSYSDRQIEASNLLNSIGSDGMTSDVVDEILNMIEDAEKVQAAPVEQPENNEAMIKYMILNEPNWRKRASLAASLISKSLE